MSNSYSYTLAPNGPASTGDRRMSSTNENLTGATTVTMRKLPKNISPEALRAMLLFAKDLSDVEVVPTDLEEDQGFSTVVARFQTVSGAMEAQAMLDGKPNGAGHAKLIVEVLNGTGMSSLGRRNTIDPTGRRNSGNASSSPSSNPAAQRSSRFNGTFQSMERSPPIIGSPPIPEHASTENQPSLQTFFSPKSPVGNNVQDRSRVSGKSVIDQDVVDDDTGELLKDPVAYMKNDVSMPSTSRRSTDPNITLGQFSNLSLSTNSMVSPPHPQYTSPRTGMHLQSPVSAASPNGGTGYQLPQHQFFRHNYPPVNPADQNPPCNTLYVGNLPIDTSEDELKAMFSKQRGYKRLCFRTKQNGPMCFVEFEDVSFATKALNELYGATLHNSVKGGIRLSFSKNPLGVRSGQPGSTNSSVLLSATGPMSMNGVGSMSPGAYSMANGPPPGLAMPPGLGMPISIGGPGVSGPMSPSMMSAQFGHQGLGIGAPTMHNMRAIPLSGNINAPANGIPMSGIYPDYMMGR